jgi:hypothetical protein
MALGLTTSTLKEKNFQNSREEVKIATSIEVWEKWILTDMNNWRRGSQRPQGKTSHLMWWEQQET